MTSPILLEHPVPGCEPPRARELDSAQQSKFEQVAEYFDKLELSPTVEKDLQRDREPISDKEKAWLTRECFLRYLSATRWKVSETIKRIEMTLAWRKSFPVDPEDGLTAEMISEENETGKQMILGFDNDCRPVLYLLPARQNTDPSHRQVQHLVYCVERVIDMMVAGQDQLAILVDHKHNKENKKSKLPPFHIGREVLNILQTHYPERLGKALMCNMPWVAWAFLKMINPFMDPITREKLVFQNQCADFIPKAQLVNEYGGDLEYTYDHSQYWPRLTELAAQRRKLYMSNFQLLGGKTGLSERDLRDPTLAERLKEQTGSG